MTTTNMIEAFEEGQQESLTEGLQSGPESSEIWSPERSDTMIIVKTLSRVGVGIRAKERRHIKKAINKQCFSQTIFKIIARG